MKKQFRSIQNLFKNKILFLNPEYHEEIQNIQNLALSGQLSENLSNQKESLLEFNEVKEENISRIAVIHVNNVIQQKEDIMSYLGYATACERIENQLKSHLNDDRVIAIVFDISSPGGTADGVNQLSKLIYESRSKKPLIAYVNEHCYSAAYYLFSACHQIILASEHSGCGSIGAYLAFRKISNPDKDGNEYFFISSVDEKADGHPVKPKTDKELERIQQSVNRSHQIFEESVQRNIGMSSDQLKPLLGKVYTGSDAIKAGLANKIMNKDELFEFITNTDFTEYGVTEMNEKLFAAITKLTGTKIENSEMALTALTGLESKIQKEDKSESNTELLSQIKEVKESLAEATLSQEDMDEAVDIEVLVKAQVASQMQAIKEDPNELVEKLEMSGRITPAEKPFVLKMAGIDFATTRDQFMSRPVNSALNTVQIPETKDEKIKVKTYADIFRESPSK
jgi:capsid assembly protease